MIRVKLIGGLGNQLFQFATARAWAEDFGATVTLDISEFAEYTLRKPEITDFALSERTIIMDDLCASKRADLSAKLTGRWHKEKKMGFDARFLRRRLRPTIRGYFQSEKYFVRYADLLRSELELADQSRITDLLPRSSKPRVALHVRRGDYVSIGDFGNCSVTYYTAAAKKMRELIGDCALFAFTDDPSWVSENLPHLSFDHIVSDGSLSSSEELFLMSRCDHFITANSSFSWWGAWLGRHEGKQVISPTPWFNPQKFDTSSVVPDAWTKLPKE